MSIKKNMFVLFMIVMMVMVAGCLDGKSGEGADVTRTVDQGIEDVDSVVDTEEATEEARPNPNMGHSTATMVETSENTFVSGSEESTVEESNAGAITETPTEIPEKSAISTESSNVETSTEAPQPPEPAPAKTEPEESETLESAIYDPYQVVNMVIAKCEAGGMITTEDNLANLLEEGKIRVCQVKCVSSLLNPFTRVCQVKCVSSLLNPFTQFSAI